MRISMGVSAGAAATLLVVAGCTVDQKGYDFDAQGGTGNAGSRAIGGSANSGTSGGGLSSGPGAAACTANPCENGGDCMPLAGGGYVCTCVTGWGGTRCESNIDDCAADRCQNGGACADRVNGYECQCSVGYHGKNCELSKDDCADEPCQNGGECRDGNARYTCVCQAGFSGLHCELVVSGCEDGPCLNGECTDTADGYSCGCDPGFDGINCEIDIDECLEDPCQNNGECVDGVNSRVCNCKQEFSGLDCESDVNECDDGPCEHGGACVEKSPGFACECPPQWTGKTCAVDVDECATAGACAPARVCANKAGGHECPCPPGGVEPDCERFFDVLPPAIESSDDCRALDVSADGAVVVGFCLRPVSQEGVAFRWTSAAGVEVLEGVDALARAVSADGSVIAGTLGASVFRWTRSGGMVDVGLSGSAVMNADGSVIAAGSNRWTAARILSIAPLIDAGAVSGTGDVIAGHGPHGMSAHRWTAAAVNELLPPSGMTNPMPTGMSTDGSVIVGYAYAEGGAVRGVIWKGAQVTTGSDLPWFSDVSGDGSIVTSTSPAAIWDASNGVQNLRDLVNSAGAAVSDSPMFATAISRDGRYVVGTIQMGSQDRAFRAKLP